MSPVRHLARSRRSVVARRLYAAERVGGPFAALLATVIAALAIATGSACAQSASAPLPGPFAPPSLDPHDLSGVWWTRDNDPNFRPIKGAIAFTPQGRAIHAARSAGLRAGSIDDPSLSRCLTPGPSRVMAAPYPILILQTQNQVTLLPEAWHAFREVYLGAQHTAPDDLDPTFMGESVGRWDGDTLVVDTIGLKDAVWLDASGLPHSDQLRIVERIRKLPGGARLEDRITFEDPKMFKRSWTARRVYEWRPDIHLTDYVCGDRNRDIAWADRLPMLPPAVPMRPTAPAVPVGAADFSGMWYHKARGAGAARAGAVGGEFRDAFTQTATGEPAPLLPWSQALLDRSRQAIAAGHPIVTPGNRCLGFGQPAFWTQPYPYKFLQTADLIVVLGEGDHQFMIIYLNQPHPKLTETTWSGNSTGRWEGGNLVIETVGQNDRSLLCGCGIPKTEALVLTQRLSLTNGGTILENRITVDDPGTYTRPWDVVWPLDRMPEDTRLLEYVCAENERDVARINAGRRGADSGSSAAPGRP